MTKPPACCLCGEPCEPWHEEPTGYGHNPYPFGEEGDRCCTDCNNSQVIPTRIGAYLSDRRSTDPNQ